MGLGCTAEDIKIESTVPRGFAVSKGAITALKRANGELGQLNGDLCFLQLFPLHSFRINLRRLV